MVIGRRYRFSLDAYYTGSGTAPKFIKLDNTYQDLTTSKTNYTYEFIAVATSGNIRTQLLLAGQKAYFDNLTMLQVGCVAEYLPENAGNLGWVESSGNQLSGQTPGSPISLNVAKRPMQYRDIKKGITNAATTLTGLVPRGYIIKSIRLKGSASLTAVKIGTSSGGEQIVASTSASTTASLATLAATANAGYSETTKQTIYIEHATAGQTLDVIFHFEKVGN